jgi:hypothetical protein
MYPTNNVTPIAEGEEEALTDEEIIQRYIDERNLQISERGNLNIIE